MIRLPPPSAKKLMTFRYSVCVMCTLASAFLFTAIHSIVKNPEIRSYDYGIVFVLVVALYIENQVIYSISSLTIKDLINHSLVIALNSLAFPYEK